MCDDVPYVHADVTSQARACLRGYIGTSSYNINITNILQNFAIYS